MFEKVQVTKIEDNQVEVVPLITDACINCNKGSCGKRGTPFFVANPKKVEIKVGDVVQLKNSFVYQIFQAIFSLLLPVLAAVLGYFLMPEKEVLQVVGVLLGFSITATVVTVASRFLPPAKSQIEKVI
jgi:hypothetical protein